MWTEGKHSRLDEKPARRLAKGRHNRRKDSLAQLTAQKKDAQRRQLGGPIGAPPRSTKTSPRGARSQTVPACPSRHAAMRATGHASPPQCLALCDGAPAQKRLSPVDARARRKHASQRKSPSRLGSRRKRIGAFLEGGGLADGGLRPKSTNLSLAQERSRTVFVMPQHVPRARARDLSGEHEMCHVPSSLPTASLSRNTHPATRWSAQAQRPFTSPSHAAPATPCRPAVSHDPEN